MKTLWTIAALAVTTIYTSGCTSGGNEQSATIQPALKDTANPVLYQSDKLIITRIAPQTYVHTSYLKTNDFGLVPCNGMIVTDQQEATILDTPADDSSATELITYLKEHQFKITAVVATHFHGDCVGGLKAFHLQHIPSYATDQTIKLLQQQRDNTFDIPEHSFSRSMELPVGKETVILTYFGPGHTKDNIVAYFPKDRVLFGGCLIKEIDATKGFLGDADTMAWSATVQKVKTAYPDVQLIIPGHGQWGSKDLLDYTMKLFALKATR